MANTNKLRDVVILKAFDATGRMVEERRVSCYEYYDGDMNILDDGEYIRGKGIRRLEGWIYSPKGKLDQHFVNVYDETGEYLDAESQSEFL